MMTITYDTCNILGGKIRLPSNASKEFQETIDALIIAAKFLNYSVERHLLANYITVNIYSGDKSPIKTSFYGLEFERDFPSRLFTRFIMDSSNNIHREEWFKKLSMIDKMKYIMKSL